MGFFSKMFTIPGSSAANNANNQLASSAQAQTDWMKKWQNEVSPYLSSLTSSITNTGTALNQPLTQLKLQQYQTPSGGYNLPSSPSNAYTGVTTPTNAYSGVTTPTLNINNLPDVYKPTAETLASIAGSIDPNAQAQSVRDSYAMNANQTLADRNNSINTAALQRGLGGRQGGMSTLDTSALSGLANERQKLAAEGNIAGYNQQNTAQNLLASLIGQRENLANTGYQNEFNNAQYQNSLRQQDYTNQMGLAGANQEYGQNNFNNQMNLANANQNWSQQDYTNKMNSIGQLRDWMMGDVNNANQTAIQEGTYNTNQQQTAANNQMQWTQLLQALLSPSTMSANASGANQTWGTVGQNANNQMAQNAGSLQLLSSLIPGLLA